jgi:hypothetical protein
MGLMGELFVLESYAIAALGASAALDSWRGPLGAAQDFVSGRVAIESKARASGSSPLVRISSEYQLDCSSLEALFLHVSILDRQSTETDGDFTLSEIATRVRDRIVTFDIECVPVYDALLAAAGFDYQHDYSPYPFSGGARTLYVVSGAFPRITGATIPAGATSVQYDLHLGTCVDFVVSPSEALRALRGGR